MNKLYSLRKREWQVIEEIFAWCELNIGKRSDTTWKYNPVYNDIVIYGEKNIVLYNLKWN